jgi:hypothetical protein
MSKQDTQAKSHTIDLLNWRYATKKMQPDIAVPADKLNRILEAIRLSAYFGEFDQRFRSYPITC